MIVHVGGHHDYDAALYGAMPADAPPMRRASGHLASDEGLRLAAEADALHVGWPEFFLRYDEDQLDECLRFADALARLPVKIIWTMHNRLPHAWPREGGRRLYEAWARLAAGVIHHSRWGMDLARAELPYPPGVLHVVIPHGHYGELNRVERPRAELERELELAPCALRIGVIGRPQRARGTALIMEGLTACRRDDVQLLVSALEPGDAHPDDPRLAVRPRKTPWVERTELARQVAVCDALAAAHDGPSYLTSGIPADAVGAGLPMIVNPWPFFTETLGAAAIRFDGTARDFARAVDELTPDALAHARAASRALRQRHTFRAAAAELLALYRRLDLA